MYELKIYEKYRTICLAFTLDVFIICKMFVHVQIILDFELCRNAKGYIRFITV